ncbi:hypothetical protein [Brevibacterium aurantiacum]|uniref:hypothetical protein n=1 Tax=Brevibacterium aurantiacum TaxID=273384 RepID=UPI00084C7E01|nr:hypothetical protein [Brevibacterium aurantiacum]RCS98001.1 hypothetical protein CIK60_11010 [Brevibacterium aurantiacum]
MKLPAIYEQPIDGLENFEMSGDDLAVTADCFRKINARENGDRLPEQGKAATDPMPKQNPEGD